MCAIQRVQPHLRSGMRLHSKVVLLQSIVIASFSFWMFKEYENNQYFQEYVRGKFPTGLPFLVVAGGLALGVIGFGLCSILRRRGRSRSGRRDAPAPIVPGSPRLERAAPKIQASGVVARESAPSLSSIAGSHSLVSPASGPVEAPVLKRIEPTPGLAQRMSEPRPFPVIIRIEPPEEPVEDHQPEAPQPVLKRIAPTQLSSGPRSPLGWVRRVEPDLEPSGRRLVWTSRSDMRETGPANSQEVPVLDNVPFTGMEEPRDGSKETTPKKRPGPAKPRPGQSSRNERTA